MPVNFKLHLKLIEQTNISISEQLLSLSLYQ